MLLTKTGKGTARSRQIWDAPDLESRSTWRLELPEEVGNEFLHLVCRRPDLARDVESFRLEPATLPLLQEMAAGVSHNLLQGDGLTVLKGLHELGLTPEEQRLFYVAFGRALGEPMLQYGLTYEVRDRGRSYRNEAIPVSMTGSATGFHTDSSARNTVPDYVGLLCEQPSHNGGESLVSNALRVHQLLEEHAPEILAILYKDFVRDVVTPGVEKTRENLLRNRIAVFASSPRPEGVLFRYMRYWIEVGQQKADQPLSREELRALDILDELISDPDQVASFQLEAGDILWVNNRTLAHNRSGYQDTPENVRLLHRMWIKAH